jgi:hypothetical protein
MSLVLITSTRLMAQSVSLGGAVDYNDDNFTQKNNPNPEMSYSYNSINMSVMADFTYIRLNAGYQKSVGRYHTTSNLEDFSNADSTTLYYSFLTFYAVAKYPVDIAGKHVLYLWPASGFEYDFNLTAKLSGKTVPRKRLNDFYFLVGLGMDYYVSSRIAITFSPFYGLNLTPKPSSGSPGSWLGERGIILLGVLYKL